MKDRLASNPDFQDLWKEGGLISDEITRVESQLTRGREIDEHNLGFLRGRLAALRWLKQAVEQRDDEEEQPAPTVPQRRTMVEALGFLRPIR